MLRTHGIGPLTLVVCLVTATVFAACKDDKPATPPAEASATATAKATGLSAAPATSGAAAPTAAIVLIQGNPFEQPSAVSSAPIAAAVAGLHSLPLLPDR